jgi:ApaG protein
LNSVESHPVQGKGSETVTHGVRVRVWPSFLPDQSDPAQHRFIFSYRIRITNESGGRVRLLSRHWRIIDADGDVKEVRGDGVVGQQPILADGHTFEYSSFCPLETEWGTMEGTYTFETAEAQLVEVAVARFILVGSKVGAQAARANN